jgi:hypothetical protein
MCRRKRVIAKWYMMQIFGDLLDLYRVFGIGDGFGWLANVDGDIFMSADCF